MQTFRFILFFVLSGCEQAFCLDPNAELQQNNNTIFITSDFEKKKSLAKLICICMPDLKLATLIVTTGVGAICAYGVNVIFTSYCCELGPKSQMCPELLCKRRHHVQGCAAALNVGTTAKPQGRS